MVITKPQGPFKTAVVLDNGKIIPVARVFTQGRGWTVKSLDGSRWDAERGMTTNCKIFPTRRAAIEFVKAVWLSV